MSHQLSTFVETLRLSGLLKPAQVEQVAAWAAADAADPQAIAKEIVKRGWLTGYQVKMFWKGRGNELFFNQYVVMDRLGEGGMGEVYKAKHLRMDRVVAMKVIRPEKLKNRDTVKRFGREVQAAASLAHENIVMAYDADQANGRHFFAMEFVDGKNLAQLVKEKHPLPVLDVCDYIRQAAIGLQHAFEKGMVHRDIKPSNLLLNGKGTVKVLDMGLARLLDTDDSDEQSRITQEGLVVGTPDFLAPEQARNARAADIRADVYALGCTFYYLLCGHPPYVGGTPTEKMLRHSVDPIPPVSRPDVPPGLTAIIHKMMAKRPEDRYQTPAAVVGAIQAFMNPAAPQPQYFEPMPAYLQAPLPAANVPLVPPAMPVAPPPRQPYEPSRTEMEFQLPPPPAEDLPPDSSRRNLLIAFLVGVIVLGGAAGGIYYFVKKAGSGPSDENLEKQFVNNHDMKFVLIPAGSFEMGSRPDEQGRGTDEGPVHPVKISKAFYMSATEVTLKQYQSVMGRLPRAYRSDPEDNGLPVAFVSHTDARAFVERLNKDPQAHAAGWEYRLPTEAEWEYACRAGTSARYWSGNALVKTQAHFGEAKGAGPTRCGQFPANAWGLLDMHGNVAEWTADSYDENYYANSPPDDPPGPDSRRTLFVARGGGFTDPADNCRGARRLGMKEETLAPDLGFRVVYARVKK